MPSSIDALKQAVELEQQALDQYIIAMDNAVHEETKQTLKEYADDKQQKIDTLSWMIMAESGDLEKEESTPQTGGEKLAAGKCPFSKGELKEMGFDMSQSTMGDDRFKS
jgi:rubrerythrin